MSPVVWTLSFWAMLIGLAIVLWNMANSGGSQENALPQMSYSDFMANVDRSIEQAPPPQGGPASGPLG